MVGEHDSNIRFLTVSKNMAASRMRNETYEICPLFMAESPKFLNPIRNIGRKTRWLRRILTGCRYMAALGMNSENICNLALICGRMAKIPSSYRISGSGNTTVTPDF